LPPGLRPPPDFHHRAAGQLAPSKATQFPLETVPGERIPAVEPGHSAQIASFSPFANAVPSERKGERICGHNHGLDLPINLPAYQPQQIVLQSRIRLETLKKQKTATVGHLGAVILLAEHITSELKVRK